MRASAAVSLCGTILCLLWQCVRSCLFVPATPGSALANSIREIERNNRQGRTHRIKIVEQSGTTVRNILANNYPWAPTTCNDLLCYPCSSSSGTSDKLISCRRPGVGYQISCLLCKNMEVIAIYHGESGRNMYTRGKEHLQGLANGTPFNCLLIHNNMYHNGSKNPHLGWRLRIVSGRLWTDRWMSL